MSDSRRQQELDWIRGWMLALMTVTHLPTWFSAAFGQPLGFVSAAEGFVLVSGFLVGLVHSRTAREKGFRAMRGKLWRRAGTVYLAHCAVLLLLFAVIVPFASMRSAHPVTDLASFYLSHPLPALAGSLLLVYNPPLLDILPMYVVFLLVSPPILRTGMRQGWAGIVVASVALWLLAQFGGARALYGAIASLTDLAIPYNQTGAFSWLAWQLVWISGLAVGTLAASAQDEGRVAFARLRTPAFAVVAGAVAIGFFAWRHVAGQSPHVPADIAAALDKWHLGLLRIIDFAALVVLASVARERIAQWARHSWLTVLGSVPLTVFCAHLVACLVALALVADPAPATLHWRDLLLLGGTLAGLFGVAVATLEGRKLWGLVSARRTSARTAR